MYKIGAVLENDKARVALYDSEYKPCLKREGTAAELCALCLSVIVDGGVTPAEVAYVGLACDGQQDIAALEASVGIKCLSAPLMGARALGEAYMENDLPFLVMLKIDDRVESGIVVDKKLYPAPNGAGADIGAMVVNVGGYECSCGRRGCFEAYVSRAGLVRIASEAGVQGAKVLTHRELYGMNTPEAERAKKLYAEYMAGGLTNLINLFQPNELVLEGAFVEAGEALMGPVMDIVLREQYTRGMPQQCNVRFARDAAETELLGAALLGR